ncbi:uncharacterized protein LOC121373524 isoform X2 [Gigantopelta aegis]|nr:uncharacterized protein LOC121373524 isoform X2 [Gigantopelta aegis]
MDIRHQRVRAQMDYMNKFGTFNGMRETTSVATTTMTTKMTTTTENLKRPQQRRLPSYPASTTPREEAPGTVYSAAKQLDARESAGDNIRLPHRGHIERPASRISNSRIPHRGQTETPEAASIHTRLPNRGHIKSPASGGNHNRIADRVQTKPPGSIKSVLRHSNGAQNRSNSKLSHSPHGPGIPHVTQGDGLKNQQNEGGVVLNGPADLKEVQKAKPQAKTAEGNAHGSDRPRQEVVTPIAITTEPTRDPVVKLLIDSHKTAIPSSIAHESASSRGMSQSIERLQPGKELLPNRETPPAKEVLPNKDMPPIRRRPLGRERSPNGEPPPNIRIPPTRRLPPPRGMPPARRLPPNRGVSPGDTNRKTSPSSPQRTKSTLGRLFSFPNMDALNAFLAQAFTSLLQIYSSAKTKISQGRSVPSAFSRTSLMKMIARMKRSRLNDSQGVMDVTRMPVTTTEAPPLVLFYPSSEVEASKPPAKVVSNRPHRQRDRNVGSRFSHSKPTVSRTIRRKVLLEPVSRRLTTGSRRGNEFTDLRLMQLQMKQAQRNTQHMHGDWSDGIHTYTRTRDPYSRGNVNVFRQFHGPHVSFDRRNRGSFLVGESSYQRRKIQQMDERSRREKRRRLQLALLLRKHNEQREHMPGRNLSNARRTAAKSPDLHPINSLMRIAPPKPQKNQTLLTRNAVWYRPNTRKSLMQRSG